MERAYRAEAATMAASIKTLAQRPENLDNFESYLSAHFGEWLRKFANTPGDMAAEMREFADMDI